MASTNIDELYAELYPNSPSADRGQVAAQQRCKNSNTEAENKCMTSSFDDDEGDGLAVKKSSQKQTISPVNCTVSKVADFDDDDDVGEESSPTAAAGGFGSHKAKNASHAPSVGNFNTVPFPNVSHPVYEGLGSYHRCTLASRGYVCGPNTSTRARSGEHRGGQRHTEEVTNNGGVGEAERLRALYNTNSTPAALSALAKDPALHRELLKSKGAYHVVAPKRGNGCCDYSSVAVCEGTEDTADATRILRLMAASQLSSSWEGPSSPSSPVSASISPIDARDTSRAGAIGGCPFLICRKCDHPVVRHEGVRWYASKLAKKSTTTPTYTRSGGSTSEEGVENEAEAFVLDEDAEAETNLYLVVRNYYPDWSRIATASISPGASSVSSLAHVSAQMASKNSQQKAQERLSSNKRSEETFERGESKLKAGGGKAVPSSGIEAFDDTSSEDDDRSCASKPSGGNLSTPMSSPLGIGLRSISKGGNGGETAEGESTSGASEHSRYALISDPNAAAYCCQCSWLTVHGTRVGSCIATTLADVATHAHTPTPQGMLTRFISVVACGKGLDYKQYRGQRDADMRRRLPLWACKGHIQ